MNPKTFKYDVLVVGAGPAGSMAANTVARRGLSVLLIDKKKSIGERPHCGEFIPERLLTEFDLARRIVQQRVDSMQTLVFNDDVAHRDTVRRRILHEFGANITVTVDIEGQALSGPKETSAAEILTPSPGYMIDRQLLDLDLAKRAAQKGAVVISGAKLDRFDGRRSIIKYRSHEITVESTVIIAADGPNSGIAQRISPVRPDFLVGVQCQAPLVKRLDRTIIFFSKAITYGYGWLFPKGLSANLGLGMFPIKESRPIELLDFFSGLFRDRGLIKPGIFSRSKGLIPVSGLRNQLVDRNVALVGDAAGLTHPITGAGVPQAMVSGELAGNAAVDAIEANDMNLLKNYETTIRELYSGVLNHARDKRRLMTDLWSGMDMDSICSETWIAFRGYRKRVRNR